MLPDNHDLCYLVFDYTDGSPCPHTIDKCAFLILKRIPVKSQLQNVSFIDELPLQIALPHFSFFWF